MRLKSIKLSGFKSFVDPTTLPLRNNLIGVVGPNGCGKSNIVDALRWVLGESSARQLRGDALADVIFSGSSGRKPVGQASVELVFDNSDGSLTGNYGQYGEISVRRQATRDGQSVYFLNGTRCRRRDVTDLFLGTGLGPRSYAIIEQGMISRLIEARPEELRNFIEEAAGISRYKERRRETETRIRHTRENMDRVADLQDELAKRLITLKRQAETAEHFAQLKQQQRVLSGQLVTLEFAGLAAAGEQQHLLTATAEIDLEACNARQTEQEKLLEQLRGQQTEANVSMASAQQNYYEAGAEIARHEQAIGNAREALQRLNQSSQQLQVQQLELEQHISEDFGRCEQIEKQLAATEPELTSVDTLQQNQQQLLQTAESQQLEVVELRENRLRDQRDAQRRQQQESQSVTQLEQRLQRLTDSHQRLQTQMQETTALETGESIDQLIVKIADGSERQLTFDRAMATIDEGRQSRAKKCQLLVIELDKQRTALQVYRGEQASLLALQESAQAGGARGSEWLKKTGLDQLSQLFNEIQVKPNWEGAVEQFLGARLSARLVESLDLAREFDPLTTPLVTLFERENGQSSGVSGKTDSELANLGIYPLVDQVESALSLTKLFATSYSAANLEQALGGRDQLPENGVLVTPEGVLIGRDWLEFPGAIEDTSLLQRAQRLQQLKIDINAAEIAVQVSDEALRAAQGKLEASDAELQKLQAQRQQATGDKLRFEGELNRLKADRERQQKERLRLAAELDHQSTQLQQEQQDLAAAQQNLLRAETDLSQVGAELQPLEAQQQQAGGAVASARQTLATTASAHRELETTCQRYRLELEQLQRGDRRWSQQLENVRTQLIDVRRQIEEGGPPIEQQEQALQQALQQREQVNEALTAARKLLEQVEQRLQQADQALQAAQLQVSQQRQALETMRLKEQELRVREATLQEQATRDGFDLLTLLPELDDSWVKSDLEAKHERTGKRIDQLGAINLAAIDEHRQVAERKSYLDAQQADLDEALATMTDAIKRIDRETRGRFRDTFDKVNHGLQALFPQLFGGGIAQLELVGDDLLTAGVAITAQPPGKRNSSIQLLSGGEKALTAIALVFAIFQLNPAPFCVLDEVDAPLDDANVGRFCAMVRKMSDQVQFVFITHNKTTMELAQQLAGVTMGEPGVSRLVAVDVDEAAKLVGV